MAGKRISTVTVERAALLALADGLDQLARSLEALHQRVVALEQQKENASKV